MAIIKHKPVKNSNYGAALEYVMFQHNEDTGEIIRDEYGQKILREEYYLDGINVDPMRYAQECVALNKQYKKNQTERDVKAHHYIISFDPQDSKEHGLTGKRAQELGVEYAKKYFPGFQTIVCTHMDGSHHSGNIHVHIFFNSVRKHDVAPEPFLESPKDCKAGYKHHETKAYMNTLKQAVMNMCEREGLNQVDLLTPPPVKITEQEYLANKIGQRNLDKINKEIEAEGLTPKRTKFQTQKQWLRDAIDHVLGKATSFEEFSDLLWEEYNISVSESRGAISYTHPDRDKNIRGRSLGSHYEKDYILGKIEENKNRLLEEAHSKPHPYDPSYDYISHPMTVLYIQTCLRLVVDLQTCIKAQTSPAYAEKVKLSNLQQMAETLIFVEEHGYDTLAELSKDSLDLSRQKDAAYTDLKKSQAALKDVNEQIHYTGSYLANKKIYAQMLHSDNKKAFRQEHAKEITAYEEARAYLKAKYPDTDFPSMKILKSSKEKLKTQISEQKQIYDGLNSKASELSIVKQNVDIMLEPSPAKTKHKIQDVSL